VTDSAWRGGNSWERFLQGPGLSEVVREAEAIAVCVRVCGQSKDGERGIIRIGPTVERGEGGGRGGVNFGFWSWRWALASTTVLIH
jgi:hypothetical protein